MVTVNLFGEKKSGSGEKKIGRLIGYARVSREDQNIEMQIEALLKAGCERRFIFKDHTSGAKSERPGLDTCLQELKTEDTLIVWRLDRLGRSSSHLVNLVEQLKNKGVRFRSICDGVIDTTTASGELVFGIFSSFCQFERHLIQERTKAGLEIARARGRVGGRKPMDPSDPRVKAAKEMHANKQVTINEICAALRISRQSLYHTKKPDRDNLQKYVSDILEAAGVFKNDSQVAYGFSGKFYSTSPRTEIWITQLS